MISSDTGDDWPASFFEKKLQSGSDLGERMKAAFQQAFEAGFQKVVIIGSDCPEIGAKVIEQAFDQLDETQVVLGPANDGGYYLLGMNGLFNLFDDVNWSTATVRQETCDKVKAANLTFKELPELTDLDTIDDLVKFPKL
ncbi:MAG: TIGR04282 family arsenosugar biosynthesis glycosyltransferase [Owenweeksia sp.]|nr:TIGR04282 family arsenosugar biosynthesis glycosyltransferase [Owenweeksia sp.]